jgi:antitoxin component YwqK of YwqJK toxin-antitoxin module
MDSQKLEQRIAELQEEKSILDIKQKYAEFLLHEETSDLILRQLNFREFMIILDKIFLNQNFNRQESKKFFLSKQTGLLLLLESKIKMLFEEEKQSSLLGIVTQIWNKLQPFEEVEENQNENSIEKKGPQPPVLNIPKFVELKDQDGNPFISYFELDGKKEGEYKEFWPGTDIIRLNLFFKGGLRHGRYILRFRNGNIHRDRSYENNLVEGNCFEYLEDKTLTEFAQYKADKKDGIYRKYKPDGSNSKQEFYENDQVTMHPDGTGRII